MPVVAELDDRRSVYDRDHMTIDFNGESCPLPWPPGPLQGRLPRVWIEDYRRYLTAANDRDWTVVAEFVAGEVRVNGRFIDRATYVGDLRRLAIAHPDHRWEIADLLHDGDRVAVRLITTRSAGRSFELAQYRWCDRRIIEVWTIGADPVTADL